MHHFHLVVYSLISDSNHCFLNVHLSPHNSIFHISVHLTKTQTILSSTEVWLGHPCEFPKTQRHMNYSTDFHNDRLSLYDSHISREIVRLSILTHLHKKSQHICSFRQLTLLLSAAVIAESVKVPSLQHARYHYIAIQILRIHSVHLVYP